MDSLEFCMVTQKPLKLLYQPNLAMWQASFEDGEVKDGGMLAGLWGGGKVVEEAINDYLRQIRGRTIVFDAMGSSRREFFVPPDLGGLPWVDVDRGSRTKRPVGW